MHQNCAAFSILLLTFFAGGLQNGVECKEPLNCTCGQSGVPIKQRIIGGYETQPHEFPWMAALVLANANNRLYCGGSILSDRHILTAGHCVYYIDPFQLRVVVGLHDIAAMDGTVHDIAAVQLHPRFEPLELFDNVDVAIVRTRLPIAFRAARTISICLPPAKEPLERYDNLRATVAGWGIADNAQNTPDRLKATPLRVFAYRKCTEAPAVGPMMRPDTMICAYERSGDACQGDSGGPLFYERSFNRFEQIGVTSFGSKCATPDVPGIYYPVMHGLDWIRSVMEEANTCRDPLQQRM